MPGTVEMRDREVIRGGTLSLRGQRASSLNSGPFYSYPEFSNPEHREPNEMRESGNCGGTLSLREFTQSKKRRRVKGLE
jgi:hypothetical protein